MKGMKYESAKVSDVELYLDDIAWAAEQKLDGVRILAHVREGRVDFLGAGGQAVTFAAAAQWFEQVEADLLSLPAGAVLDGELLIETGDYWLFDLPYLPGLDQPVKPETPHAIRRTVLEKLVPLLKAKHVHLCPQATTTAAKRKLWKRVQADGAEGIVVKRTDAPYVIGRRASVVLKIKVTKTIDVFVTELGVNGAENAELALMRDGEPVVVGKCSMIGKPKVKVGDAIEVQYLYVNNPANPRLYQPRMMRKRPDKTAAECGWDQLPPETNRHVVGMSAV
jgi:ATP-dependent DNA ligase